MTVVDPLAVPMQAVLGRDAGLALQRLHADHGVAFRLARGAQVVHGASRIEAVELDDGSVVRADAVLVGIGARPATDWLTGGGLDVSSGLTCDQYLAAGPHIAGPGTSSTGTTPATAGGCASSTGRTPRTGVRAQRGRLRLRPRPQLTSSGRRTKSGSAAGRRWADEALDAPDGDRAPTPARAEALWVAARVCLLQGDHEVAARRLDECEAAATRLHLAEAAAQCRGLRGLAAQLRGDLTEAESQFEVVPEDNPPGPRSKLAT